MSIIDLKEITPNNWKAKYQGNYGTYTIKIATDGKSKPSSFSCTCPSTYYPCKHVPLVLAEIKKRKVRIEKPSSKENRMSVEEVLKHVSLDELQNFVARLAKYNPELTNAIMLEFSHKAEKKGSNKYSPIIREALQEWQDENEEEEEWYGYDYCIEIDALDQWLEKAQKYADQGDYGESVWICKACIEEYAAWLQGEGREMQDYLDESYQCTPFEILKEVISVSDAFAKELFDYCKIEMQKEKYKGTVFHSEYNDLMGELAPTVDPESFLALQDELLAEISDKKSNEAQQVFQRKVDFYRQAGQPEKAWEIIENNLQIDFFRKELTEKKIAENKLTEAKMLISEQPAGNDNYHHSVWYILLLAIAEKENDVAGIRRISFSLIENRFEPTYYEKYKSTFSSSAWALEVERLIRHYQQRNNVFSHSAAKVMLQENLTERLMNYVEKHLSIELLENYHTYFPSPEKTLLLFRKSIDKYAQTNMGRNHYEYIARLLAQMKKISGGQTVVNEMLSHYKIIYRNRRAMMEVLGIR